MRVSFFTRKKMWRNCNRNNMSNEGFLFLNFFNIFKFCKELNFEEDYIPTLTDSIDNDRYEKESNEIDFDDELSDLLDELDNTTNEEDSSDIESIEGSINLYDIESKIFRNSPTSITQHPHSIKDTKKLKIDLIVRTILIPTVDEYKKCNLSKDLWYSLDEIEKFRKDFLREVNIKFLLTNN